MPSLGGPLLKIERAHEHLKTLQAEIKEFLKSEPYRTIGEDEPDTGDYVLRGEILRGPPQWLGPIIGDVVHNLRSSLDHLAYQLALTRFDTPGRVRFPVFLDPGPGDNCFNPWGIRQIKRLPDLAKVMIEGMQPYHAGKDWLWELHSLWLTDKHKLMPLVASHGAGWLSAVDLPGDDEASLRDFLSTITWNTGVFQNGDEILRIPSRWAHLKEELSPHLAFDVAFHVEGPPNGKPVLTVLEYLHDQVRYRTVEKFGRFFL